MDEEGTIWIDECSSLLSMLRIDSVFIFLMQRENEYEEFNDHDIEQRASMTNIGATI